MDEFFVLEYLIYLSRLTKKVTLNTIKYNNYIMSSSDSVKQLMKKLQSSNSGDVYNALVKIRTSYINKPEQMKKLQKYSVVEIIISYLEHPKLCNVSLSLIANACLEDSLRVQVIQNDGIKSLIRIMKSLANDDILNRACRALGNIALSDIGYNAILKTKPIFQIVRFLTGTEDVNCQQTAVRTLRILGNTAKARETIVQENGILSIAKLLQSNHREVLQCSIRALAILTRNCSVGCASQLLQCECIPKMIELYFHSNKQIQENALMSLRNLTHQEQMRSTLVQEGAVQLFVDVASTNNIKRKTLAALALCSCIDHMHMWEQYNVTRVSGLKVLLDLLKDDESADIHLKIISSLFPLSFEADTVDILLELELVQILIGILKKFTELNKFVHTLPMPDDVSDNSDSQVCERIVELDDVNQSENWEFSGDGYCSGADIPDIASGIDIPTSTTIPSDLLPDASSIVSDKSSKFLNSFTRENSVEFSINSPSYKGIQKSDAITSVYSYSSGYSSYCSPGSPYQHSGSNTNCDSPIGQYDWNFSPFSNSSFAGSWSPSSDPDEDPVCWSPVLSSHPNSEVDESEFNELENISSCCSVTDKFSVSSHQPALNSNDIADAFVNQNMLPSSSNSRDMQTFYEEIPSMTTSINSISTNYLFQISNPSINNKIAPLTVKEFEEKYFKKSTTSNKMNNHVKVELPEKKRDSSKLENDIIKSFVTDNYDLSSMKKKPKLELFENLPNDKTSSNARYVAKQKRKQKREIDYYILLLLLQISSRLKKKTNSVIASKACFGVLMDYLCNATDPCPRAGKVLIKLVKNRYSFEKLVMCGFMSEVEERIIYPHSSRSCSRCKKLDDIKQKLFLASQLEAESDYGVGTLSHILLTTEKSSQLHALYTFSKFVTLKAGLHELLFNSDGLSLLLSSLTDDDEMVNQFASVCVCYLYRNLVKYGKAENESCEKHFNCPGELGLTSGCNYANSTYDITFLLDDDVTVNASRKFLCDNSEYFNALLEGYFFEKEQDVISLPQISEVVLSTIFHFLHNCRAETCEYIQKIQFKVLLDLLSQCDRFLLFDLKVFAEKRLESYLQPTTVSKIYHFAKLHNSPNLTEKAVHFALSLDVSRKEILTKCIRDLIVLHPELNFVNDIKMMIKKKFMNMC